MKEAGKGGSAAAAAAAPALGKGANVLSLIFY